MHLRKQFHKDCEELVKAETSEVYFSLVYWFLPRQSWKGGYGSLPHAPLWPELRPGGRDVD